MSGWKGSCPWCNGMEVEFPKPLECGVYYSLKCGVCGKSVNAIAMLNDEALALITSRPAVNTSGSEDAVKAA